MSVEGSIQRRLESRKGEGSGGGTRRKYGRIAWEATYTSQVRQWEIGPAGNPRPSRMTIRASTDSKVTGYEGDTLYSDCGLRWIIVYYPRIVRFLEGNLRFERASPKERTMGSVD